MRFGEAAGIKRDAILRDGREVHVATVLTRSGLKDVSKTSKSARVVPIPEHLRVRLLRVVMSTPPGCLVFVDAHLGGLADANVRGRILATACDRAGVRRFGLHHLRHAFASWLTKEGIGSFEVASALEHSTVRMMSRYAHLTTASPTPSNGPGTGLHWHCAGIVRPQHRFRQEHP